MKLWLLNHTVILKIFNPCSSVRRGTNGGMSLWIEMYLLTEEGMCPSLTWTELACAEGCFSNDHCKLLLVIGAEEVLPMAFAGCITSLCSAGCWDVGCCSAAALRWCSDTLHCTRCCLHLSRLFQLVKPPQEEAGRNKAFETWVYCTWCLLLKSKYLCNNLQNP